MTTDLHPDLIAIADAIQILSETSYQVLDQIRQVEEIEGSLADDLPPLVSTLTTDMYDRLYVRPSDQSGPS